MSQLTKADIQAAFESALATTPTSATGVYGMLKDIKTAIASIPAAVQLSPQVLPVAEELQEPEAQTVKIFLVMIRPQARRKLKVFLRGSQKLQKKAYRK